MYGPVTKTAAQPQIPPTEKKNGIGRESKRKDYKRYIS